MSFVGRSQKASTPEKWPLISQIGLEMSSWLSGHLTTTLFWECLLRVPVPYVSLDSSQV